MENALDRLLASVTTDLFQFYGLDLVAALLIVASVWQLGHGRRSGFVLGAGSGVLWAVFGVVVMSMPIIVCNTALAIVNVRSYVRHRPAAAGAEGGGAAA